MTNDLEIYTTENGYNYLVSISLNNIGEARIGYFFSVFDPPEELDFVANFIGIDEENNKMMFENRLIKSSFTKQEDINNIVYSVVSDYCYRLQNKGDL